MQRLLSQCLHLVMSGLEPIGSVPDLTKLSRDSLAHGLSNIEESLNSILRYSFFQTIEMRRTLVAGCVTGTCRSSMFSSPVQEKPSECLACRDR